MSEGNLDAYLVEQGKDVLLHLRRLGATKEEAEDIIQNTYVKLLTLLATITSEQIRPWLYRVAINEFFDLKRKRKTMLEKQGQLMILNEAQPSELSLENQELLLSVLHQLSATHRDVLILKYYFDMSYEEIAMILESNLETVRTTLYRARKAAKKIVKEHEYERE